MPEARVLVIDEDESGRARLADMLQQEGHTVVAAEDISSALYEAATQDFDVAFVDIYMPERDGLQVLGMLRCVSPETRFVMMSGVRDAELEETCLRRGAEALLHKPLHLKPTNGFADRLLHVRGSPC